MVCLRLERFSKGKHQNLHSRIARSYKVLKRIGSNAYEVGCLNISSIFNVEVLTIFHGHHEDENVDIQELQLLTIPKLQAQIGDVL